jgi:hypothetical protein
LLIWAFTEAAHLKKMWIPCEHGQRLETKRCRRQLLKARNIRRPFT